MKKIIFIAALFCFQILNTKAQQSFKPADLSVMWQLLGNDHLGKAQFLASFTLFNKGKTEIDLKDFKLYFSYPRVINSVISSNAKFENLSGEFCRIVFDGNAKSLKSGEKVIVEYIANGKSKNYTDAPSGLYIVFNKQPDQGYPIVNFERDYLLDKEVAQLKLAPAKVYEENKQIADLPMENLVPILPSPNEYKAKTGNFILYKNTTLNFASEFESEANLFNEELSKLLGVKLTSSKAENSIILKKIEGLVDEAYELSVKENRIVISSSSKNGAFYAIQSLKMMMPPNSWAKKQVEIQIPCAEVKDAPRFGYRSFMLDVARNFQTKEQILKVLDLLALYKINTLHFHLNDDEGWRLEIPGLPELTTVGATRAHTLNDQNYLHPSYGSGALPNTFPGSGFYSKADFIEILKYAKARHIKVIPELETPGHARAAIKAMDARYEKYKNTDLISAKQYLLRDTLDQSVYKSVQGFKDNVMNIAMPSTYTFIEKVVDEVREMYILADAPLQTIHIGGDEVPEGVWQKSPAIATFMQKENIKNYNDLWYEHLSKVNEILKKKNLYLSGWEEVAMRKTSLDGTTKYLANPDFTTQNFHAYVWNNVWGWGQEDLAYRLANAGYKVVLSAVTNFYFDLAYEQDADEPGLYWGSFVDVDKPFYFIPLDYYKSAKEDVQGKPVDQKIFEHKERLTDYGASNIVGIQCQIWSEKISGAEQLEYMLLPKLLGFAERAWAKNPNWAIEKDSKIANVNYLKDWTWFVNVLGKREFTRLNHYASGFNYRIPTVGVNIEEGKVHANVQFPGLIIKYTQNGSEPTLKSKTYTSPITQGGSIKFKAFNSVGRGGRTISIH
ncbi:family 20 glycosylhydrolase [Pedobacter insulae]|uniref:beta-N-acetylhexosaminidase n=1 Tax=Pedobacter insulae TaxID=414048 RepID=A0A1I2V8P6_9SPHI|nr:family 20 glycosylhydrolase [Pedobacter insulae]SFG83541.1 hexosaminidase [Pedobacter insulae]